MDNWLVGLLILQSGVGAVAASVLVLLMRRLRILEERIDARIEKSETIEMHFEQNRTSIQSDRQRDLELYGPLKILKTAKGLEALKAIKQLADLGQKVRPFAEALLNKLKVEKSAAVRIYLIDAIAKTEDPRALQAAVDFGLDDPDQAIVAHCAMLAGRHKLDFERIRRSLRSLSNGDANSFAVKRFSGWALSRFHRGTKSPELDLPQLEHFGYVLVKSMLSSTTLLKKLLEEKCWEKFPRGAGVIDASLIQGNNDVLLKVAARDKHYFDDFVMNELQGLDWINEATQTLQIISPPYMLHWIRWDTEQPPKFDASSWVLIHAPAAASSLVMLAIRDLAQFSAVQEAAAILGPAEIMLNLGCQTQQSIDDVVKKLGEIPYVRSTESFRVFEPAASNHIRCSGESITRLYATVKAD